ncbi:MAG TPA: glycosyltransferase family 1 protein [Candidatus Saccharimonadales bacterium]
MSRKTSETPKHIVIDARIRRASTGRPVDRLVEFLEDLDHVNHYTILVQPDDPWKMRAGNFQTLPCPFPQFSFNPMDQVKFAWQLYRLKPDLVHFTMTQQPLLYFNRHIVTMTHDLTMLEFVRRGTTPVPVYKFKMALYRFLLWWGHHKSEKIIVPTNGVKKELIAYQPFTKPKIEVVYEAGAIAAQGKAVQPKGVDGEYITYVGTVFPHKNAFKLIEAFDILHAERPNLKLVFVGKMEKHREELRVWAKNRPSYKNIVFTGFIPDEALKWVFEHCKAYVFASLSEGWGLPPLEAMAYGVPVASSNASVMPEVLGDAAHYFDPRDVEDMAQKIGEVLDDKQLRERLIKAGYAQNKKYSWEKMAEETLSIYRKILNEK